MSTSPIDDALTAPTHAWPDWASIDEPSGTLLIQAAAMLQDEQLLAANAVTWGAVIQMMALRTCAPALPRHILLDRAMSTVEENRDSVQEVVEALMPEPALMAPWSSAGAA